MSPSIEVLKFKATKSRDRPADVVKIEKVCPGIEHLRFFLIFIFL
jgi:hypothetical protein